MVRAVTVSPCNGTCRLDAAARFCVGCLRTTHEIVGWGAMTDGQRRAVMASLPQRRDAGATPGAGTIDQLRR